MFSHKHKGLGKDYSTKKEELFNSKAKLKIIIVYLILWLDPGPGSYRSPSDFGHYDG